MALPTESQEHISEPKDIGTNPTLAEEVKKLSDEELADQIELPPRVFQELLQEFGRDEIIALVVNVAATSLADALQVHKILLALSGPIVEKIGLFLYPALRRYLLQKNLSGAERDGISQNLIKIWQEGRPTLIRDVALHDPIYTLLLLFELQNFPDTPVALLSAIAFTISILLTFSTEIGGREALHKLQLKRLEWQGFELEEIFESRVVLQMSLKEATEALTEIQSKFGFPEIIRASYHDTYYDNASGQNGRKMKVRHRVRTEEADSGLTEAASIQVLFEKLTSKNRGFYPSSKDKLRLFPDSKQYQAYLQKFADTESQSEIYCSRDYMHSGGVYVSCDQFLGKANGGKTNSTKRPIITIEVKADRNNREAIRVQQEIIYYLISKYPDKITQTNWPKNRLSVDWRNEIQVEKAREKT